MGRCQLLGAHLEGPFISSTRKGAHPLADICLPSLPALEERISGFEDQISLMTLAPELGGSKAVIEQLSDLGVVVALGHSEADQVIAAKAFELGVRMLTHTFNAMQGLHHRKPGPIWKAIEDRSIAMGLIADGVHVHPGMISLLHRIAPEQLVLVSDALAVYGLKGGKYKWDQRFLLVDKGTCYLEDGTLVGVAFSLLEGSKRLAKWTGDPSWAIWVATNAPREVLQGKDENTHQYLLGKSIQELLRWKFDSSQNDLSWQRAA